MGKTNQKETLLPHQTRSNEELVELMKSTKVITLLNEGMRKQFQNDNGLTDLEMVALAAVTAVYIPDAHNMVVDKDCKITYEELHDYYDRSITNFIIVRRVNYILHETMIAVYDYLEKNNKLRFTTKKQYLRAEEAWDRYLEPMQKKIERSAWFLFQDHLRLAYETLHPRIEKLYESVRDYMIRLGFRDIELKGRIEVALIMYKMAHSTYKSFFKDFHEACGVDFSRCYATDKMDDMAKQFVAMAEVMGIKTVRDEYGCYDISGFDGEKSQRVKWAWEDFILDLRDDDLMDESAKKAIDLNPKAKEEYKAAIEDEEKKRMSVATDKLSKKFKVSKL